MTDSFIIRCVQMLHAGKRGSPFPPNTEFSEMELKSYENRLTALVVLLLRTPNIDENIWISPIMYAYRYEPGRKTTQFTWLERLHVGLLATNEFLKSFLSNAQESSYHIEVNESPGVAIAFNNSSASANASDSIDSNQIPVIIQELMHLREALKAESKSADDDIAIAHVALAEKAAKTGDKKGIVENLKKAGGWAFDVATKIGVSVTSKIIENMIKGQ